MKIVKWIIIIASIIALLFYFVALPIMREQTKKHSPQRTASYTKNGLEIVVNYSSPFKKGRIIFGELVPYNEVWRTGANEPTVFNTKTDLNIQGEKLAAGTYSVWTIPGESQWQFILNKEVPDWGVAMNTGKSSRNEKYDALTVAVPTEKLDPSVENFTIAFENEGQLYLIFAWDTIKISVPINP
ncbi:DUF2911 domain-containing protein [Arenibacter sp. GZD96]|uniref:DUF2911 domain-containing protein n=1 Tax=Aurantibrevibacter litoralis TaxID=3106030 RepID=UPI002AFF1604|nr:DUF2911 domain-containing protein [Arenibacter sp. GZD-96]MEA1785034.1 DUF2911 domain-containing protein [Arenibacter sp. GZD-96]